MATRPKARLNYFPLFADLDGRTVVVVGGGAVAARKISLLRRAGARVSVVAAALAPELEALSAAGYIAWPAERFSPEQLDDAWLVVAATDDRAVNAAVAAAARERRLPVNVVDDPAASTVIVPAIVDRSPLVVAISTGGAAPVLARRVRAEIESLLDGSWAALARLCGAWRPRIVRSLPQVDGRRRFYEWLVDGPVRRLLAADRRGEAARLLDSALHSGEWRHARPGSVALVGAGPGDPGLLTLNALRALQSAEVILHDHLVSEAVLDLARRDAERIAVGKRAGGVTVPQQRINELMAQHAGAGRRVVRLKGGDPFIFGRGGEELEYLRERGIPYEVVPGITAAVACAAYAGVPLTHRDHSQSVRFLTAHCRDSLDTLDWACLARERQTLAIYMGVAHVREIEDALIRHGLTPGTPVAVVENGSRPGQRVLTGTLAGLAQRVRVAGVVSPALLVVGPVAGLADRLAWFGAHAGTGHATADDIADPARTAA